MQLLNQIIDIIRKWIVKNKKYFIASIVFGVIIISLLLLYMILTGALPMEWNMISAVEFIFRLLVGIIGVAFGFFGFFMLFKLLFRGAEEFIDDFLLSGYFGRIALILAFSSILYGHYKRETLQNQGRFIYVIAFVILQAIIVLVYKKRKGEL